MKGGHTMSLHGWIIYNGTLPGNKFIDFAEWLQRAATKQGSSTNLLKNNDLLTYFNHNQLDLLQMNPKKLPNYVIMTDKDLYLTRQLELLGIPVYNSAKTIEISDDKIFTHQILAASGIPTPKTIVAPKIYFQTAALADDFFTKIIAVLGLPLIIKESFGSFGEQVYLVKTLEELRYQVNKIGAKPYFFQEFVQTSSGRDLRIQVVGDQVIAAMKRTAVDDFRANVTNGGTMAAHTPTDKEVEIAIQASKAIGAHFSGVDLLYGPDDEPVVCEINSNAHILNLYDCTGINCADAMLKHILHHAQHKGVSNTHARLVDL